MPNWTENDYVKRAGEIASQHAVSKKSLNDLCEKVARDENMNPNEIRTLVRLANVATFQELFKRKDDGDKMVEFDTGDPEQVIHRLVDSADGGESSETANIHNDKMASEIPDQMREVRQGFKFEPAPVVKVASDTDEIPVKLGRTDLVILNLEKLAREFEVERQIVGHRWEETLDKLATEFRRLPNSYLRDTVTLFEKNALATYGQDIVPELTYLTGQLRMTLAVPPNEKIAELQERHVVAEDKYLRLMKTAHEARQHYLKFANGLEWIKKNTPKIGS